MDKRLWEKWLRAKRGDPSGEADVGKPQEIWCHLRPEKGKRMEQNTSDIWHIISTK